ncbi:hypothetical protein AB0C31_51120, partial [Actinoplanes philippinensis]
PCPCSANLTGPRSPRRRRAAAGRAGPQPFETMAARLVDAQAPGAAGAVRRLAGFAGGGPQWADRLLGELALLRLLVSGHARLGTLDPALAATVRSRIGFPTPAEEVLAGPRVTDRWQVLGQVETDEGSLTSRRTWLHGAGGRFALILSFAAPGRPLPADLIPGTEFRGDLCFYPGAAPLRALVAEQASAAEPFGAPDGPGTIRAGLSRWASFIAAEPWRYDAPMLLAGVRPTADGHLVDEEGSALPLAPGHREPWWLLAAAGARPVTVAAEWSPSGLRPVAAWADGRFVPAAPPVPDSSSRRPAELPPELLTAALVGTSRRPWSAKSLRVGPLTVSLSATPSTLPRAATHTEPAHLAELAGHDEPTTHAGPIPPAQPVDFSRPAALGEPPSLTHRVTVAEPATHTETAALSAPLVLAEPADVAGPATFSEPTAPGKPAGLAGPAFPTEPEALAEPAEPASLAAPAEPGESTPAPLATPAKPGESTPAPLATPAKPGESTPAPLATPAEPGESTPAPLATPVEP